MKITIYGTASCPYCVKAKEHASTLPNAEITYFDIHRDGIQREELESLMGKPVRTVPQILVNDLPVGGYDDFLALTSTGA